MKVILLERIERLGQMGDVVAVKPGFARNFLLPRNKALRANTANLEYFQAQKVKLEAQNLSRKSDAEAAAKKMADVSITLIRAAGETGHLYGAIRTRDIAESLAAQKITVERSQVVIKTPVKTLGQHEIVIVLHSDVHVTIPVLIAQSEEEAQAHKKRIEDAQTAKAAVAQPDAANETTES